MASERIGRSLSGFLFTHCSTGRKTVKGTASLKAANRLIADEQIGFHLQTIVSATHLLTSPHAVVGVKNPVTDWAF